METKAPFSNLIRLSTSEVSRLSYKRFRLLNIKIFKKYLDSIVLFDVWVGESDCSSIVGNYIGDLVGAH